VKTVILTDLDDTLFQSKKKCPLGVELIPAATLVDGTLFSWMTPKQQHLLQTWVQSGAEVIPVTARSLAAFRRVKYSFLDGAIVQHGGLILDAKGEIDRDWWLECQTLLEPYRKQMQEIHQAVVDFSAQQGTLADVWITAEEGLDFYVLLKNRDRETRDLGEFGDRLQEWAKQFGGFWQHRNGNNWALLPNVLGKHHAVEYWKARRDSETQETLWIGVGDSETDLPFMKSCDYCMFPRKSQIAEVCFGN
jgi:hydroxymethylpyrimidine pyrophosphatase-like HAD family hydrolase